MHAAAAVLFSLFVVTAENQPAPARSAAVRQPIVVAAKVPTLPAAAPAPVEAPPASPAPLTHHRIIAPPVANAPAVQAPIVIEPREEVRVPALVGNSGFSPATKIVMQFRVKDHTTSPTATSAELESAATIGLMQDEVATESEPAVADEMYSDYPAAPLPDASPVVVAAEPVTPVEAPVHTTKVARAESIDTGFSESSATTPSLAASSTAEKSNAERNSFFNELKNGVQAGINKVMPASHNRENHDSLFGPSDISTTASAPAPNKAKAVAKKEAAKPASKVTTAKPAPATRAVAKESSRNFVRPANKTTPSSSHAQQQPKHNHHHADRLVAAPRKLPHATPAAATSRAVQDPDRPEPAPVLPPTLSNPSVSNPALSNGPLTGPGPFDYLYTGQEMPPWVRPYDEDPNLRNFWYHTEPRLKHGKVPHCCSTCNLLPHIEYFPEAHANFYFRPYTFTRLLQQQDQAARMGINPALPYSNEIYDKVYAEFEARKRTETVEPGEMPGEMQEFETDTEQPAPPSSEG